MIFQGPPSLLHITRNSDSLTVRNFLQTMFIHISDRGIYKFSGAQNDIFLAPGTASTTSTTPTQSAQNNHAFSLFELLASKHEQFIFLSLVAVYFIY
jgi:hypothetical protein